MTNIQTYPHQDKFTFEKAILYSSDLTQFNKALIEKDYYCSLILRALYAKPESQSIVFKGGTLLNKVHIGFYRLSEDLDFTIPMSPQSSRKERSTKIQPFKVIVEEISSSIPDLTLQIPLHGSNNSVQYNATFIYPSLFTTEPGTIFFEIGLREELLHPSIQGQARTLAIDPFTNNPLIDLFAVTCLTKEEAYAEKFRAALAREKPAIRDLFDIYYVLESNKLDVENQQFITLVKTKLTHPVSRTIDLSEDKKQDLKRQIDAALTSVLTSTDFNNFDFESAWQSLADIGATLLH